MWLRHGKKRKYRRRHGTKAREKQRETKKKRSIEERPDVINERLRVGDWEGDTVVGRQGELERILTYVERSSGYLVASLLAAGTAENVRNATNATLGRLPKDKRRSCTYDNGVEFSYNEMIEKETGMVDILLILTHHGNEEVMRTPMVFSKNISQRKVRLLP